MNKIYGTDYYLSYIACSLIISLFANVDYNECMSNINNIELFYKSINNLKDKLHKFLNTANISRFIQNNHIEIKSENYKKKPLLNGKYGPIVFIHLILNYLNAKYMIEVASLLTDMILNRKITIQTSNMEGGCTNYSKIT